MKSIFRFSIVMISIVMMSVFACHRKKVDYIGPAYVSAPEGFAITSFTATPSPVNFASSSVSFNASFTNTVSWILTITGQTSGAVHIIKGTSNSLNNVVWKGNQDEAIFFRAGETATATLSFFGTSLTSSVNIDISGIPDYRTCGKFPKGGDFENADTSLVLSRYSPTYYAPDWAEFDFPTPIPNVQQGIDSMSVDYNGSPVPSCHGKNYYYIKGLGNQAQFVSGIQYIGWSSTGTILPSNPDQVWVNMYIYSTGDANAQVDLEYQESDFDGSASGYQGSDDDAWVAHITLNHKGWKLFSFQYSKLVASTNAAFGGSGNKIYEPNNLRSFDLILLKKSDANSPVEVYFDYPIITVGGPFSPTCK